MRLRDKPPILATKLFRSCSSNNEDGRSLDPAERGQEVPAKSTVTANLAEYDDSVLGELSSDAEMRRGPQVSRRVEDALAKGLDLLKPTTKSVTSLLLVQAV